MLIKVFAVILMIWFGVSALSIFSRKEPMVLKIFGSLTYCFVVVGSYHLFQRNISAQWILQISSILFFIFLLLNGILQFFAHWFMINQDRIPALKEAMSTGDLSKEQKRKFHLYQSLKKQKEDGEDIQVNSMQELNDLIQEFEIDQEAEEEEVEPDQIFDLLNTDSEHFNGIESQTKLKLRMIVFMYTGFLLLIILLFFYIRSESFANLLN